MTKGRFVSLLRAFLAAALSLFLLSQWRVMGGHLFVLSFLLSLSISIIIQVRKPLS